MACSSEEYMSSLCKRTCANRSVSFISAVHFLEGSSFLLSLGFSVSSSLAWIPCSMAQKGGARRKPAAEVGVMTLQEFLTKYMMHSSSPFQFGVYNTLRRSQAAHGVGLLGCKEFLEMYLRVCPDGSVQSRTLANVLLGLVQTGIMARYPLNHPCWEGLQNITEGGSLKLWCDRQVGKVVIILNHFEESGLQPSQRVSSTSTHG